MSLPVTAPVNAAKRKRRSLRTASILPVSRRDQSPEPPLSSPWLSSVWSPWLLSPWSSHVVVVGSQEGGWVSSPWSSPLWSPEVSSPCSTSPCVSTSVSSPLYVTVTSTGTAPGVSSLATATVPLATNDLPWR